MKIAWKQHAKERLAERNVTEAQVESVIADCDIEYPNAEGEADIVRIKNIGGRDVKVYLKWLGVDHVLVCTVAVRGD